MLVMIHVPGRVLFLSDIFSRQLDNVQIHRNDTNLSENQANILPALSQIKPGQLIDNETLCSALNCTPKEEFLNVNESSYTYVQRVDWQKYNNTSQLFDVRAKIYFGSPPKSDTRNSFEPTDLQEYIRY